MNENNFWPENSVDALLAKASVVIIAGVGVLCIAAALKTAKKYLAKDKVIAELLDEHGRLICYVRMTAKEYADRIEKQNATNK